MVVNVSETETGTREVINHCVGQSISASSSPSSPYSVEFSTEKEIREENLKLLVEQKTPFSSSEQERKLLGEAISEAASAKKAVKTQPNKAAKMFFTASKGTVQHFSTPLSSCI